MSIEAKRAALEKMGFVIGKRDPNMNRAFAGRYMVAESYDAGTIQDDAQGGDGVWCIVGDHLEGLITEAAQFWCDCAEYREELTEAGPQLVMPGCERIAPDNGKPHQLGLF